MSLSIHPGAIAFTRTPCGDTSVANDRTIPGYADFAAEYAMTNGIPKSDAMDAVNNMFPCFRRIISGSTARVRLKAAVTCVCKTELNSAGVVSNAGFLRCIPALLTRIEIGPDRFDTHSIRFSASSTAVIS